MRTSLATLLLATTIGALLTMSPVDAGAAVPDKPFTETLCEGSSDSVARLYTAGLGREPEQGGFDFWINEYSNGTWSFPAMAQFFVNSDEFTASYGSLTQDAFIRQLYRNVLGREGESGGVTYWNQQMTAGMSRATVLMRFAESPENVATSGTVEPELGYFNVGIQGSWRCGPSVSDSLFKLGDFSAGWTQVISTGSNAPTTRSVCEAAFDFPVQHGESIQFSGEGSYGPFVAQASYIAPTPYGAEAYIAQVRQAITDCSTYSLDNGLTVAINEINLAGLDGVNADWVAYSLHFTAPLDPIGFTLNRVAIQDHLVVTTVGHLDNDFTDPLDTEIWAELAAGRVAGLPYNS